LVHPIFSIKITILREFFALFPDTAIYKNRSGTLWDIYGCSKKKREISVCTPPKMVEERKDSRTQRKKTNNKKFDY